MPFVSAPVVGSAAAGIATGASAGAALAVTAGALGAVMSAGSSCALVSGPGSGIGNDAPARTDAASAVFCSAVAAASGCLAVATGMAGAVTTAGMTRARSRGSVMTTGASDDVGWAAAISASGVLAL